MRRFLHSRLAIAIAASILTITAIGGVTYATSSTSGDTYYACAAVNGMIRPSWIRLNTAPERCPISTDHIVQWAAGGQPIAPKSGVVIPLAGTLTLDRATSPGDVRASWPAVDTSMCSAAVVNLEWTSAGAFPNGERLDVTLEARSTANGVALGYATSSIPGNGFAYLRPTLSTSHGGLRFEFGGSAIGGSQIMSAWTAVTVRLLNENYYPVGYSVDVNGEIYCTPY